MRKYITFGSQDGETWRELGVEEASSPDQARRQARDANADWTHYSATTLRGWAPATPTDKTVTTWEEINPDQLTLDDEPDDEEDADEPDEKAAAIAEARQVLGE